jgi:xanthine dehydrogenase accessory factor
MKNIHRQLFEYMQSGERIVLATVVRTSGSTPQKPGSSALFGEKGLIAGTVGGGLLEGEVQQIARHVLISEVSDMYYFNLDTDQGEGGAICGGEAEVLVDANPSATQQVMEEMHQSLSRRMVGNILTVVIKEPGGGCSIERYWIEGNEGNAKPAGCDPELWHLITDHLSEKPEQGFREIKVATGTGTGKWSVFLESYGPMPRLVIAGAGHVGKALAHLASLLDFEITMVDDRKEFACRENIPDADRFIVEDIGTAMKGLSPGPDTYIVIVTRGHHHDAEALRPCIGSDAAYLGMIGSAHKVSVMKKRFIEEGWATAGQWSRIHTPIGIPIGSKSVQEIAISIAAQLVSIRSQKQSEYAL